MVISGGFTHFRELPERKRELSEDLERLQNKKIEH